MHDTNTPPTNRFKRGLQERRKQMGFWLTSDSLATTELAARIGFDWLLLDMEHTALDVGRVEHHVLAARGGTAELVVRVPSIDPVIVKRLLDTGVRSFMFPFVQSVEEARLAAASTLYPPRGIRGFSGIHRANSFTLHRDYLKNYANEQCVIVQIESPKAVAAIPEISTVDGIDGIFVGPNDLAFNLGANGNTSDPAVQKKIEEALGLILKGSKAAGILNFNTTDAKRQLGMGFDHIAVGGDMAAVAVGARALVETMRQPGSN